MSTTELRVNRAKFASRWYPGKPEQLKRDLHHYLSQAKEYPPLLRAAILPHAGLSYSGYGMADAFANIDPRGYRQVVILAPSHYVALAPDLLHVEEFDSHETPLGPIPGDPEFWTPEPREGLAGALVPANGAVEMEHALELFFPFVRNTFGERVRLSLALVPPLSSMDAVERLADLLQERVERGAGWQKTFFIISSDFTHYGRRFGYTPFGRGPRKEVEEKVAASDVEVATEAAECRVKDLFRRFSESETTICGRYPILLGSELFRRLGFRGEVARYYNSNLLGPATEEFVCYASILFTSQEAP
ncbi:MAG: AmmeMemoRadiSam system protein B [Spirochaetaceae bacterium]